MGTSASREREKSWTRWGSTWNVGWDRASCGPQLRDPVGHQDIACRSLEKTNRPPSEYIASLPADVRNDIAHLHQLISGIMTDQPKAMWEGRFWGGSDQQIIGYGDYSYRKSDGETVEWFIVGLAAQQNYISIYVSATTDGGYLTERYVDRLGKVRVGKSSISFRSIDDLDLDELADLIAECNRLMT